MTIGSKTPTVNLEGYLIGVFRKIFKHTLKAKTKMHSMEQFIRRTFVLRLIFIDG
jgi:hypothetical protein